MMSKVGIVGAWLVLAAHAWAQSVETKSGGAVTLNDNSEMFSTHMTNGGTVTQNSTSRVALKGNLSNTGTYASADTAVTEFNGSGTQSITSSNALDFGRLKVNNTSTDQLVNLHGDADCYKIEVASGHLTLCNTVTQVFSTDTSSSDPMVAVKTGTTLTVDGCTLKLSGGKLYVFSAASTSGLLELQGTPDKPAVIDLRSGASRYATEIQGQFSATQFKILSGDTSGLYFKKVTNNLDPIVLKLDHGTFDGATTNGTYIKLTDGNPMRFDVFEANMLIGVRFDNSGSATGVTNVTSASTTTLKAASGLSLNYVTFKSWLGTMGGEPNDSEAGGENKIRWQTAPADPTSLAQYKMDASTSISVGGTTDQNMVVVKATVSHSDSNQCQLEVEIKTVGTGFDGSSTLISGLVNSGSTATVNYYGLANGNYHWRARTKDYLGAISNWVSFGGNAESANDFVVSVTNNAPDAPTSANQYKSDGSTVIASQGTTTETTVKFKATLTDGDASETIQLQVEVKMYGLPFDGQADTYLSAAVTTGQTATVTVSGLAEGMYAWQYRAIDSKGHASAWTSFPPDTLFDFQVATLVTPPVITTSSHKTKDNTPLISGTKPTNTSIEVFANGVSVGSIASDASTSWSLSTSSLSDGTYLITAKATSGANTSQPSIAITLTIDTVAPLPPAWITCTAQNGAALIEWGASPSSDVYGYHVYRKLDTDGEGSWTKITTNPVSASTRKYLDTGRTNGTKYNYKVTAVDDADPN